MATTTSNQFSSLQDDDEEELVLEGERASTNSQKGWNDNVTVSSQSSSDISATMASCRKDQTKEKSKHVRKRTAPFKVKFSKNTEIVRIS
jgi:hypothetical protein